MTYIIYFAHGVGDSDVIRYLFIDFDVWLEIYVLIKVCMSTVSKINQKEPAAIQSLKGYELFCWQSLSLFTQASFEFGSQVPCVG